MSSFLWSSLNLSKISFPQAGDIDQSADCPPDAHEAPQDPNELGMMAPACILSPGEAEAGGSGVRSHPRLHSKSEVSLDSMRARDGDPVLLNRTHTGTAYYRGSYHGLPLQSLRGWIRASAAVLERLSPGFLFVYVRGSSGLGKRVPVHVGHGAEPLQGQRHTPSPLSRLQARSTTGTGV